MGGIEISLAPERQPRESGRRAASHVVLLGGAVDRQLGVPVHVGSVTSSQRQRGSIHLDCCGETDKLLLVHHDHLRRTPVRPGAVVRGRLEPLGAEFISASEALCNAQGCLTRIGDAAADIIASDQVHLTEKGSVFLVASIIDRLLGGEASAGKGR